MHTFVDAANLRQTPEKLIDRIYDTKLLIDSNKVDDIKKGYLIGYHTDMPMNGPVLSILLVSDYQHQLPAKPDFVIEFSNGIPDSFNALTLPIAGNRYEPVELDAILNNNASINELCKIIIFYLKCHKYTHLLILENFSQLQIFVEYLTQYYFSSRTFYFEYFC